VEAGASYTSMSRNENKPPPDLVKGALAGLVGGVAGASAKMAAEQFFPPRPDGRTPPPVAWAERVTNRSIEGAERQVAYKTIHFLFGALAGAAYGALVEFEPSLAAWRGAAFGVTLNRITHEWLLPKMDLSAEPNRQPTQERISEWVTHAVYGVATDTTRRMVRKRM
jgi:putative membrane protein